MEEAREGRGGCGVGVEATFADAEDLLGEDREEHCYGEAEEDGCGEPLEFFEEGTHADNFALGKRRFLVCGFGALDDAFGGAGVRVLAGEVEEGEEG